ncbi:tryptophan synthase alpha chain [Nicoletella semolina]|uniref:Tryptophan synthase alpha chain n=1 Tax=Nicoletella semolina TaxID=271160 RepID=A0A4R2NA18_9PAST|nr:tryptophan synthase subunit alpha [Nicoletella semolina]MDH2925370.1 tryptophan synthase subunit alpha [Nicoletella semolina]TCP17847.1 tryptophan synthase alpha chain [Nicoletella semolina]
MSRFDTLFHKLKAKNEGAFVPFVTLCDPDFERSFEIIETLIANGADALELGFPFSDPLLDGPVIQAANKRALDAGHSTESCFNLMVKIREKYPDIPIGLLLCANLVFVPSAAEFFARCAKTGVDAVLIADLPVAYAQEFADEAKEHGIQLVFICPPNADSITINKIAIFTGGYTYLVSRAGVTSAENQQHASNLANLVDLLKRSDAAPILQGFGIAKPEQVKEALNLGCDGAISGSAIVKIIEKNLENQTALLTELGQFIREMKAATR